MTRGLAGTVRDLLDRVDEANDGTLGAAADLVLQALEQDGLVHVAASGHSLAMVLETFYRAGGLAAVRPLWLPEMLPLADARGSTRAERTSGVAQQVVDRAAPTPADVAVVFSTTGRNPYPVEAAIALRQRGTPVVAVTSPEAGRVAEQRHGSSLLQHADVVLDSAAPPGDVAHPPDAPRTSAVSTITAGYVWALLLAELDDRAGRRGVELPLWRSANLPDGDRANADLMTRFGPRVPELGVTT